MAVSERYIDWEDVDPVETSIASIKLRVPHAGLAELHPADLATIIDQLALLGAVPVPTDLKDLLPAIAEGRVDAHENPLENIHTYGIHRHHPFVSLTGHFYGVRGLYANAAAFAAFPR